MSNPVNPWEGCETTEKAQRALDRLKEAYPSAALPPGLEALAASESGVHDMYMNLKRQLDEGKLGKQEKMLVAIGLAAAVGSPSAVRFFGAAGREAGLDAQNVIDAVSVAGVCTIFNGYYHFRDLAEEGEFDSFRAPFNANTFMKSTLNVAQTELICIAVSSYNGCHMCVRGHNAKARSAGVTNEQIDEAIKAAATAQALAVIEKSLAATEETMAT